MTIARRVWDVFTGPAATQFATHETALLVILAASLVVFRTFRERSLVVWIAGWLAYLGARLTLASNPGQLSPTRVAAGQAEFMLAVSLFVAGAFLYTRARHFLAPLMAIGLSLVVFAWLEGFYWPQSPGLRLALEFSYRLLALAAAVAMLRFRRWQMGSWIFAAALLLVHLQEWQTGSQLAVGGRIFSDALLALGMLVVIFDQSRLEMRRLAALNSLTSLVRSGQDTTFAASSALQPFARLLRAEAVWVRLAGGRRLTIFHQIGLSAEFLRDRVSIAENDELERIPPDLRPAVLTLSASGEVSLAGKREKLRQIVVTAIPGKKAVLGYLVFASKRSRSYASDELEFLTAATGQLGSAIENLRLIQEMLRSHRQWGDAFDSIQDLVLLHDSEFHILKANPALLGRLSRSPAEVVGQLLEAVLPNPGTAWKKCPYCHGREEGLYEGPDPFGGFSLASTSTYLDQGTKQKCTIHVVRDVTERRTREQKYQSLFEQMHEGVLATQLDGTLVECNDAFVRMLGHLDGEELIGRNLDRDFYASPEQRQGFRRELEVNNLVRNFEVNLRRKDGSIMTALETGFASRDQAGEISGYQGFLLDVTEKKQAEDELRRRNRELNALNAMAVIATQSFDLDEILNLTLRQVVSLFRAGSGSVYLAESENHFRCRANWGRSPGRNPRMAEATFPQGLGDLVMRSRAEVLTEEYLPHLPERVSEFVRAGDRACTLWVVLWGKDAPIGLVGISRGLGDEYSNNEQNLLVSIGRQLATTVEKVRLYEETSKAYEHLRSAQEQLLQSEKMAAIGQLIAGVAHELNNPLTAILGYAQLLGTEKLEARAIDFTEKIAKQAQRTHRVVQNLLSFARQRKPDRHDFDVVKVLEETLLLRDYDLKVSDIKLEREIHGSIPAVSGDPHQLEQVFLNIINNAIDAILEQKAKGGPCRLQVRILAEHSHIVIQFQDSGPGFKEPSRIFEPFYTTKNEGKGTGLGLSICYGIVKEHGGEVSARNAEGGGAVIEVRLPRAAGVEAELEPARPRQRRESVLAGAILLVDDEEAVLEFEREVLAGAGARVLSATSLEKIKAVLEQEPINALIINGKMPGSSSVPETRRWICESWPQLSSHLLFTFSSLAEPEVRSFLEQNNVPFLVKPFEIGDLIAKARKLLLKGQAAAGGL